MMPTNCKNCGAVLVNGKCEYCRADYNYTFSERHPASNLTSINLKIAGEQFSATPKPIMTQENYDNLKNAYTQNMIGRGGLYGSVMLSSFRQNLAQYDTSEIDELVHRINDEPIIMCDPAGHDIHKAKRSLWERIRHG